MCAWCGTRFKILLCGPPGHPKTVHIARVNSCRFSIGLRCTSTFRGGSSKVVQTAPGAPGRGGQPPVPSSWVPGGPPRVCAWCGTRFKIFLCGPPGHPKTVHIARVNSCRFSIGLRCTSTFRGGSSRRRLALPGGAVSRPYHLPGCRGGPPACVRGVGRVSKYFFVAPLATPKPSILPESTLVGFP